MGQEYPIYRVDWVAEDWIARGCWVVPEAMAPWAAEMCGWRMFA